MERYTMNLEQQKELINLYNQYQTIDKDIIKTNIKRYMAQNNIKPGTLAVLTNIPVQTIYQLRKDNNQYKPDFMITVVICNALEIEVTAIMNRTKGE